MARGRHVVTRYSDEASGILQRRSKRDVRVGMGVAWMFGVPG